MRNSNTVGDTLGELTEQKAVEYMESIGFQTLPPYIRSKSGKVVSTPSLINVAGKTMSWAHKTDPDEMIKVAFDQVMGIDFIIHCGSYAFGVDATADPGSLNKKSSMGTLRVPFLREKLRVLDKKTNILLPFGGILVLYFPEYISEPASVVEDRIYDAVSIKDAPTVVIVEVE